MTQTAHPVAAVALAAAVGAVVAVIATLLLADGGRDATRAPTIDAPAALATDAARLEALDERLDGFERRLAVLELAPSGAIERASVDGVTRAELDALARELAALRDGSDGVATAPGDGTPAAPDSTIDPRKQELLAKLEQYLEETDETTAAEREAIVAEKLQRRVDDEVTAWNKRLDLDAFQQESMRGAIVDRDARRAEYTRLAAEGADGEYLAELKAEDHAAFRSDLETFLTPEQVESFDAVLESKSVKF